MKELTEKVRLKLYRRTLKFAFLWILLLVILSMGIIRLIRGAEAFPVAFFIGGIFLAFYTAVFLILGRKLPGGKYLELKEDYFVFTENKGKKKRIWYHEVEEMKIEKERSLMICKNQGRVHYSLPLWWGDLPKLVHRLQDQGVLLSRPLAQAENP